MLQSKEFVAAQRKKKIIIAAICGPVFTTTLVIVSIVLKLLPAPHSTMKDHWLKIAGITAFSVMIGLLDQLAKRLKISPEYVAAPVAFSCTLFTVLAVVIAIPILGL